MLLLVRVTPNLRLQRTRLRAPLSRKTLGTAKDQARLVAIALLACVGVAACAHLAHRGSWGSRDFMFASFDSGSVTGPSWHIWVETTGRVRIQILSGFPPGECAGEFTLMSPELEHLHVTLTKIDFAFLPERLSNPLVALHQPEMILEVAGTRGRHRVRVYDPGEIKDSPELARFLEVWNELFDQLPIKPILAGGA